MRSPTFETWDRICKPYGWPQTFTKSFLTLRVVGSALELD